MATIKSYTDISQSKKLAEILPLESADMYYSSEMVSPKFGVALSISNNIPCWSLAALLDVLNKSAYFINEDGIAEISSFRSIKWSVSLLNCGKIEPCYADNSIDACVAMVEKLNELKLL